MFLDVSVVLFQKIGLSICGLVVTKREGVTECGKGLKNQNPREGWVFLSFHSLAGNSLQYPYHDSQHLGSSNFRTGIF